MSSSNSSVSVGSGSVSINDKLPKELMEQIVAGLSIPELMRCMSVCKSWEELIKSVLRMNKNIIIHWACRPDAQGLTRALRLCPALTHLDLSELTHFNITDWGFVPTVTEYCRHVKVLKLYCATFTISDSLALAERLSSLEHMGAVQCYVTDQFLTVLFTSCPQLKVLNIAYNHANITSAPFAETPPGLKELDIRACRVGDDGFRELLGRCRHAMQYLNVAACGFLTRDCVNLIAQFTNLQHLDMSCMHWECPGAMERVFAPLSGLSKLCVLNLNDTQCIHDEDITHIVRGCPLLQELHIRGSRLLNMCLTATGLLEVGHARSLVKLDVSERQGVDDACVETFASLPQLDTLHMGGCGNITNAGVKVLAQCPSLRELDICHNMQLDDLDVLQAFMDSEESRGRLLKVRIWGTQVQHLYHRLTVDEQKMYKTINKIHLIL